MKILAVDDSRTLLLLLSSILEKLGHEVITTTEPNKAAELYRKELPDLVILDVVMTEAMSGYDCARAIRKLDKEGEWIPIIFLSSMVNDESIAKGIDAGGDDYLTKPVSDITLSAKIRSMQRIAEMRQKLVQTKDDLKKANDRLYELSYTDGLTQIANRRAFDEALKREWKRASRFSVGKEKNISLIMLDIDYFKFFNDTYGHQAGDTCLKTIARHLKGRLKRVTDLPCRYGGEEFVVLLPHQDIREANMLAEILRAEIESLKIPHKNSKVGKFVTISLGVASISAEKDGDPLKLLTEADMALYEAKKAGRNQCFSKGL